MEIVLGVNSCWKKRQIWKMRIKCCNLIKRGDNLNITELRLDNVLDKC